MIAKLKGVVEHIFDSFLILDVNGVGYKIYVLKSVLSSAKVGSEISFFIEYVLRENDVKLYGMCLLEEIDCLKSLASISGISYKTGISVLNKLGCQGFWDAIESKNHSSFKGTGVGKKMFSRILTDMGSNLKSNLNQDAISALTNLGYEHSLVYKIVRDITLEENNADTEVIIRKSLNKLALNN